MRLSQLLAESGVQPAEQRGDAEIASLNADSRTLQPREAFVCMPSDSSDTHAYIGDAIARGASTVIAHSRAGFEAAHAAEAAAWIPKELFDDAAWRLAKVAFEDVSRRMTILGVTGTNGKTSTAWILRDLLQTMGTEAAYLGTLGFHLLGEERKLRNTTPFVIDVYRMLAEAHRRGVRAIAMEVSSHALDQRRVDGIEFDVGIFTNLTVEHLDYHGDLESYAAAKARLFTEIPRQIQKPFQAAFHLEDPTGAAWSKAFPGTQLSFGRSEGRLQYRTECVAIEGVEVSVVFDGRPGYFSCPLGGSYNAENCVSAAAGLLATGISLSEVAAAMPSVRRVPGRFEAVPNPSGIRILIDYAHTPDAFEKLLDTCRALGPKRLAIVFGCGGDRDRTKRPLMAKAASERCDLTVITTDNPRTEDPRAISAEVAAGIVPGAEFQEIASRDEAIAYAMRWASPGDLVVIAGKGHENYQIIGETTYFNDDRQLALQALGARA